MLILSNNKLDIIKLIREYSNQGQKYYVYILIRPDKNEPFYVGKGSGSRSKIHLWEAKKIVSGLASKGRPSYCVNRIAKMLRNCDVPIIKIIATNLSHDEAYELEEHLVAKFGRIGIDEGGVLTNRDRGGKGGRDHRMSAERVEALIARNKASKGKPKLGMSAYIAANPDLHISRRQLGTKRSEQAKLNQSVAQKKAQVGAKIITFKSPVGTITRTKDWRAFLESNGLSYNLVRGKGKIYSKGPNAGWSVVNVEPFKT